VKRVKKGNKKKVSEKVKSEKKRKVKKKVETRKKVKCVYVKKGERRSEKGEKNKKVFVCVC
jgi:hypothetical protein